MGPGGGYFVVSTGRCGSTLVSKMLSQHPAVLSVSELLAALGPEVFAAPDMTGAQFFGLLSTPRERTTAAMRRGLSADEFLRTDRAGIPPLMVVTLPHLTEDPEALLAEIGEYLGPRPSASAARHLDQLFSWLCARLGRQLWVERSGGTLRMVRAIRSHWPSARLIWLMRDGRDTALSMSRHALFRMAAAEAGLRQAGSLGEPELLDRAAAAADSDIPIERFGEMWSWQIISNLNDLRMVPDGQLLRLHYEDLISQPSAWLTKLLDYLGLADRTPDGWIAAAASRVVPAAPRWPALPDTERDRLIASCGLGMRVLASQSR